MKINDLIKKYSLVSDQVSGVEIRIILAELELALQQTDGGDIVELGCYVGTTSLFIQRMLQDDDRVFHVYDSFSGLPEKSLLDQSPAGEQFRAGELSATKAEFIRNFKKANLKLPFIHKGWFDQLSLKDMPNTIAFAYLDGDYYQSIVDSFRLITPHLVSGARIVVDDYANEALPGAARAVDEWLKLHPGYALRVEKSLAVLMPSGGST